MSEVNFMEGSDLITSGAQPAENIPNENETAAEKLCPYCGCVTPGDYVFCDNCGCRLDD